MAFSTKYFPVKGFRFIEQQIVLLFFVLICGSLIDKLLFLQKEFEAWRTTSLELFLFGDLPNRWLDWKNHRRLGSFWILTNVERFCQGLFSTFFLVRCMWILSPSPSLPSLWFHLISWESGICCQRIPKLLRIFKRAPMRGSDTSDVFDVSR